MPSNTDDGIEVVEKMIADAIGDFACRWPQGTIDRGFIYGRRDVIAEAITAHLRDKGMVVVPRIPTREMVRAGDGEPDMSARIYEAMIQAASPVQSER